jgi:ABC-type uncharacterized transport system ATPase component
VQKEEIASAQYVTAMQLDNTVFLVETAGRSTLRRAVIIDLLKGRGKLVVEGATVRCLRSEPKRGKAVLMVFDTQTQGKRFLEVDLAALDMTLLANRS